MRWVAVAVAVAGASCGGGSRAPARTPEARPAPKPAPAPAPAPQDSAEEFDFELLDSDEDVVPALEAGAQALGCSWVANQPRAIAYHCDHATIYVAQVGRELRWVCQELDRAACRALLERIVNRALELVHEADAD